jgi:hypothetical protein
MGWSALQVNSLLSALHQVDGLSCEEVALLAGVDGGVVSLHRT